MTSKKSLIYIFILSLILQYVSSNLNCGTVAGTGLCGTCTATFLPDPTNLKNCRKDIQKCIRWTADLTKCIECATSQGLKYALYAPETICGIDNCGRPDAGTPAQCLQCSIGFRSNTAKTVCLDRIPNCRIYTSNLQCQQCQPTYEPTPNFDMCVMGTIRNCNKYLAPKKCLSCLDTFQPNPTFDLCIAGSISNCKQYLSIGKCKTCQIGYFTNLDQSRCVDSIPFCKTYDANGLCQTCVDTYMQTADLKKCIPGTLSQCKTYTSNLVCQKCYDFFQPTASGDACNVGTLTDCIRYTSNTICQRCADPKMPTSGGTVCGVGSVLNCKSYSAVGVCAACQTGYTLNGPPMSPTVCDTKIINCKTFTSDTACSVCVDTFEPTSTLAGCPPGTITNCVQYQSKGVCKTCALGYAPNAAKSACNGQINNCKTYVAATVDAITAPKGFKCSQCLDNFQPDANKLNCLTPTVSENCIRYSAQDTCTQCKNLFALDTNLCITPVTPIVDCVSYGLQTECRKCDDNKMPIATTGAQCVAGSVLNCKTYLQTSKCQACNIGYSLTVPLVGNPTCVAKILNCKTYTSNTVCTTCKDTFEPTVDSTACNAGSITKCKVYQSKGGCLTCETGYTTNQAKTLCEDSVPNCKTYDANAACTQCKDNFKTTTLGSCQAAPQAENCLTYDYVASTAGVCTQCKPTFGFTSPGTCGAVTNAIENCQLYDSTTACRKCTDPKMPVAAGAAADLCVIGTINGCISYKAFNHCQKCGLGFILSGLSIGNLCNPKQVPFCKTFSTSQFICDKCANTYEPSLDFKACNPGLIKNCQSYTSRGKCQVCDPFFQPSADSTKCLLGLIDRCIKYQAKGICKQCDSTLTPSADKSKCQNLIPNCVAYDAGDKTKCAQCADTFFLATVAGKACTAGSVTNCKVLTSLTQCTTCADGFYRQSATSCKQGSILNCLAYTSNTGTGCSICSVGLMPIAAVAAGTNPVTPAILQGQSCTSGNIANCKTYSDTRACLSCFNGFTFTFGNNPICVPKIPNCQLFSSDTVCRQCASSFQPSSDYLACNAGSITGCTKYSSKSKCMICADYKEPSIDSSACLIGSIFKCTNYESRGRCAACDAGYVLNGDKSKCENTIINCKSYNINVNPPTCNQCANTFQPSVDGSSCSTGAISNCQVYNSNNVCLTCANTYWKQNATSCKLGAIVDCLAYTSETVCFKCIDTKMPIATTGATCVDGTVVECKTYSANAVCQVCNTGYTPSGNGDACNGNIVHCKTYSTNTVCKQCDDTFQPSVDFKTCVQGILPNCLSYSQRSRCSVCIDLFEPTLDFTKCLLGMIPKCKSYLSKGLCKTCAPGYTLSTDKLKCIDTIANCKIYNAGDPTLCDQCQITFDLSVNKKTCPVGVVTGCAVYSANGVCGTCSERYIKENDTSCKLGTIADCLAYSSATVCSKCINEKMPSVADATKTPPITAGGVCVAGNVDNCRIYSANAYCATCNVGFNAVTGACVTIITNCKAYNSLTSCKLCTDNNMPSADFTSCVSGSVTNCLTYSANKKCSVCSNYYQPNFDFTACSTGLMPNCKTYAFSGKCSLCDVGYKASADMTKCQHTIANCKTYTTDGTTVTCTLCQDNFQQDTTKKTCLTGDNVNCLTYSAKDVCTKCVDGYYVASPTTCTKGTITDCVSYSSISTCTRCVEGKMPAANGATCIVGTVTGCKAYSANLFCSACNFGYTLTLNNANPPVPVGTCTGKIANCKQYNSDVSCKLCVDTFQQTIDTTKCEAGTISNCKTYTSKGQCSACINAAYTLSADKTKCLDTIANCKTYNPADLTVCSQCQNTFQPTAEKKKCNIGDNINCLTYSALNTCTACVDKTFLANPTTCTNGTIVDCLVYGSNTQCTKCIDGKMPIITTGATCVPGIISNCKSYISNAVCQTCRIGFTLNAARTECRTSIINCNVYATQTLCKQCGDGFQLSLDTTKCEKGSIGGCVSYQGYRKCAKCIQNLQPSVDKVTCISSIPNCYLYKTPTLCLACFPGFQPNADYTKCNPGTIINCKFYAGIGKCYECENGLTKNLDSTKCQSPVPYCKTLTSNNCDVCMEGFFKQSPTKCVAGSIQHCKIYSTSTTCSLCELMHQPTLDNTKCFRTIPNCRKYASTLDKCQTCILGFAPSSLGTCRKTILECESYDDQTSACINCNNGFSLANLPTGEVFCKDNSNLCTILDCAKCTQVDFCDTCTDGFQLTLDHKRCVRNSVPNCKLSQTDISCAICQIGFSTTTVTQNFKQVNKCFKCSVDNCKTCTGDNVCQVCQPGFSINNAKTACNLCKFPCLTCDATTPTKCTSCVSPTYFRTPDSAGTCILNTISNCATYNAITTTQCAQCEPFFKLSLDKKSCVRSCTFPCKQCSGTTCTACASGFYLVANTICLPCSQGCLECTSASTCTQVATGGFFLSNNVPKPCPAFCKQCGADGACTVFSDNYKGFIMIKNGNENVLASCQQGCESCSPANLEQCLVCKPGYYLNSDKCLLCSNRNCKSCDSSDSTKCLTCYPNTFITSGLDCIACSGDCLTCQDSANPSICTSCRLGFSLSGNTCSKGLIPQCNQYNPSDITQCIKCSPGYTLFDSTGGAIICAPCVSNCRFCAKGSPSTCVDCGDGFYLNTLNTCSACASNCKTCSSTGCTECNPGFRVNSAFTCSKNCIEPCATCSDYDPKVCSTCVFGYNFVGGSCQPQTTCQGGCKRCTPGYTLNVDVCVACTGQNCRTCDVGKSTCKSCMRGYYLDLTSYLCVACSAQCDGCVASSGCSSCASGYVQAKSVAKPDALTCVACQGNCLTCIDTATRCVTCKTGFQLKGWKCVKVSRINFAITLDVTLAVFNGKYLSLLSSLGGTRSDTDFMQFETIKEGSVILEGSIDPVFSTTSTQFSTQLSTVQSALSGGTLDGMKIISSSITVSGQSSSSKPEEDNSLAIILGICIPVGVLIIAIVIYVVHKKMTPQIKDGKLDDDTKMTSKHELQKNQFEMSDNILRNN